MIDEETGLLKGWNAVEGLDGTNRYYPKGKENNLDFELLKKSSDNLNLNELSMGMSSDFEEAVLNGSTFLRLGTIILGERKSI